MIHFCDRCNKAVSAILSEHLTGPARVSGELAEKFRQRVQVLASSLCPEHMEGNLFVGVYPSRCPTWCEPEPTEREAFEDEIDKWRNDEAAMLIHTENSEDGWCFIESRGIVHGVVHRSIGMLCENFLPLCELKDAYPSYDAAHYGALLTGAIKEEPSDPDLCNFKCRTTFNEDGSITQRIMTQEAWKDLKVQEDLRKMVLLARRIYKRHAAGCCLHIVLDDGNLTDGNVEFVYGWAAATNNFEKGQHEDCVNLARMLELATEEQRKALYERYDTYAFRAGKPWWKGGSDDKG